MKDDTISRAAALTALNGCTEIYLNNLPPTIYKGDAVDAIKALPSATDTNVGGNLIDRQAAIDAFAPYAEYEPNRTNAEWVRRINMVLSALPSAQPGWIPCDRELPKPNEEDGNGFYKAYLVQDGRWMDVARWDGKYWVAWGYSIVLLNVVAWMPLPAPYIPEGDDKHEG